MPDTDPTFAIGIDGGGTQTQFVVIDNQFTEMTRVVGGPTNIRNVGEAVALYTLKEGIISVIRHAGLSPSHIAAIGIGIAGVDSLDEQTAIREGLAADFPTSKILID